MGIKTELNEQMLQECIKRETPEKLMEYLSCFLDAGDSANCLTTIGKNSDTYSSCLSSIDEEYKIMANYEDKTTWNGRFPTFNIYKADNEKYGVKGSPTLVVNGGVVSTARDSASLLKTICAGFDTKPEACNTELSSASPSAGFGYKEGTAGSDGGCGA